MVRLVYLLFGLVAYLIFFATFLYLIAFVGNLPWVPRTVDRGGMGLDVSAAIIVDLALVALFGLQHSVMARQGFKRSWTRFVSPPIERSTFVLFASIALMLMFVFWQPITAVVWDVGSGAAATILWVLFAAGWGLVLISTFLINHFELFGLQQVWTYRPGGASLPPKFRQPLFYRFVRHPLYLGFFIAFWATPLMTAGHLLLAAAMAVYMLIAIRYEERDLVATFGAEYEEYRVRVGMLTPRFRSRDI